MGNSPSDIDNEAVPQKVRSSHTLNKQLPSSKPYKPQSNYQQFAGAPRTTSLMMDIPKEETTKFKPKIAKNLPVAMTVNDFRIEQAPRYPKISMQKLEMAHMDVPCDPEDEADDDELMGAPFATRHNIEEQDFAVEYPKKEEHDNNKPGKKLMERKKTDSEFSDQKVIVCKKFHNGKSEKDNRKAISTQKKLMELVFEGDKCNACNKLLPKNSNYMKAPCGHTFHHECIEDRAKCPECGEIIEKGFTIY